MFVFLPLDSKSVRFLQLGTNCARFLSLCPNWASFLLSSNCVSFLLLGSNCACFLSLGSNCVSFVSSERDRLSMFIFRWLAFRKGSLLNHHFHMPGYIIQVYLQWHFPLLTVSNSWFQDNRSFTNDIISTAWFAGRNNFGS